MQGENAMDRVEKMLGRMKASKLYRCVDWDPEGKAKDLVDKFNSASRSETMTRTGEYLGKLFAHMGKECYIEPPLSLVQMRRKTDDPGQGSERL